MRDRGGARPARALVPVHAANVPQPGRFLIRCGAWALFTRLGDAELAEIAGAFELGAVHRVQPIAAGTINSNFDVDTDRGRLVRARQRGQVRGRRRVGGAARRRARRRRRRDAAAGRRARRPALRAARRHRQVGQRVPVARRSPPRAPTRSPPSIAARVRRALAAAPPRRARAAGGVAARQHLRSRSPRRALRAVRRRARSRARPRDRDPAARSSRPRPPPRAVRAAATHGIIHGDLFRDNVLWDAGQIVAILDFEQASGGSLAYDLAVCINDWCWTGAAAARPRGGADRRATSACARSPPPIVRRCLSRSAPPRPASRSRASPMSIWQGSTTPRRTSVPFWRAAKLGEARRLANLRSLL